MISASRAGGELNAECRIPSPGERFVPRWLLGGGLTHIPSGHFGAFSPTGGLVILEFGAKNQDGSLECEDHMVETVQ